MPSDLVATAATTAATAAASVVHGVAAGLHGHAAGHGAAALRGVAAGCLAALPTAVAADRVVISTAASTTSVGHVVGSVGKAGKQQKEFIFLCLNLTTVYAY